MVKDGRVAPTFSGALRSALVGPGQPEQLLSKIGAIALETIGSMFLPGIFCIPT